MKKFEFKITLIGLGDTQADAWRDVMEAMDKSAGEAAYCRQIEDDDGNPIPEESRALEHNGVTVYHTFKDGDQLDESI